MSKWECDGCLAVVGMVWKPQSRAEPVARRGGGGTGKGAGKERDVREGPSEPCESAWWGPHRLKAGGWGRCAGAAGEEEVGGGATARCSPEGKGVFEPCDGCLLTVLRLLFYRRFGWFGVGVVWLAVQEDGLAAVSVIASRAEGPAGRSGTRLGH